VSPDALHDLCEELLLRSAEALDTIPVLVGGAGLQGAPTRQYVSMGVPVADCPDQLVVWAAAIREEPTNADREATSQIWINTAELHVQALRCQPTPKDAKSIIPAATLTAAGRQSSADAWALWNHLHNLRYAGLLFQKCERVRWEGMTAIEPSGGVGGWELILRGQLDGYPEVLGT